METVMDIEIRKTIKQVASSKVAAQANDLRAREEMARRLIALGFDRVNAMTMAGLVQAR
jgi:hypothetical protein